MKRAQDFAERNGIAKAYDSYETMLLEQKPDCVYIATTPNFHYELAAWFCRDDIRSMDTIDEDTKNGFVYEICEVMDCIQRGELYSRREGIFPPSGVMYFRIFVF